MIGHEKEAEEEAYGAWKGCRAYEKCGVWLLSTRHWTTGRMGRIIQRYHDTYHRAELEFGYWAIHTTLDTPINSPLRLYSLIIQSWPTLAWNGHLSRLRVRNSGFEAANASIYLRDGIDVITR